MIGIYGGTFDPVHFGHLRTAWEVGDRLGLDEVRMLPARQPPHRDPPVAAPEQRREMLIRALAGQDRLRLDETELRRDGPSWMVDTLTALRARFGARTPLILVLGEDAFLGLPRWREPERILAQAHLAVMTRPGWGLPETGRAAEWLRERRTDRVRDLQDAPGGRIFPLEVTRLDISATRIRQLVAAGRQPRYLVPEAVLAYIEAQGLYSS